MTHQSDKDFFENNEVLQEINKQPVQPVQPTHSEIDSEIERRDKYDSLCKYPQ